MNRAGNQAVDFVLLQHQRAEHHVVFQLFAGNRFGHAFALTQLNQASDIAFTHHFRIDDFNTCAQLNALRCRDAVDFIRVAQQYASGDAAFSADCRRFDGTRFVAFRQHYAFTGFTRQLGQLVAERRRRETTATLGSGGQRLDPLSVNVVRDVFLNFLDALMVINRDFQIEALQAQRSLPGVGVHHKDRQTGGECAFAQFRNACVHFIAAGQQQSADFYAVHRGQASCDQYVRTVSGGH